MEIVVQYIYLIYIRCILKTSCDIFKNEFLNVESSQDVLT